MALADDLIATVRHRYPDDQTLQEALQTLLAGVELLPRHEFQAQCDLLASLEAQVARLELRLTKIESSQTK